LRLEFSLEAANKAKLEFELKTDPLPKERHSWQRAAVQR